MSKLKMQVTSTRFVKCTEQPPPAGDGQTYTNENNIKEEEKLRLRSERKEGRVTVR